MTVKAFRNKRPKIHPSTFISERAMIIGNVEIDAGSSVWPNAILRGDVHTIKIGANTNVQDNVVIHTPHQYEAPVIVGRNVSIGHSAVLHGCEIGDNSLIGIHAVILDRARIGSWVLVGAGAIVPANIDIPSKSLVLGIPGKVARQLNDEDLKYIEENAKTYVRLAEEYRKKSKI